MKVVVNGQEFATKKALLTYARQLLARLGVTPDVEAADPDAYDFIWSLLQRHPRAEQKLADVKRVEVGEPVSSKPSKRVYGVWLNYENGERDDVSLLNKCISGGEGTIASKLRDAFREAVKPQVLQFRRASKAKECVACGDAAAYENLDVDHKVQFIDLMTSFMDGRTDVPSTFDSVDGIIHRKFKACDADFETAWIAYHAEHARLQMVCKCNRVSLRAARKKGDAMAQLPGSCADVCKQLADSSVSS